jgi:hypothetical protein
MWRGAAMRRGILVDDPAALYDCRTLKKTDHGEETRC